MHWLETLDIALFRFINRDLSNPIFDSVMPFASGNAFFFPVLIILGGVLICKGGARGVICVLMLAIVVSLCDGWICREIKHAVERQRPFLVLPEVHCLLGKGGSPSMPSSHAANWFAAAMVAWVYYRRSLWFSLPLALIVSFSRVYCGVHYPSDVLVGAIVGAGWAVAMMWALETGWRVIGQRWFPLWWEANPSLLRAEFKARNDEFEGEPEFASPRFKGISSAKMPEPKVQTPRHATMDQHWLRLGYVVIALLLFARLWYIASGTVELAEDEAYQWLWSKHLALSYFSKPPLIAYVQFLGTSLWGDNAFGVRFFSPVCAAILSVLTLRFFAREVNARAGFFLLLIVSTIPLLSVGSVLMTVDPLLVLFWTAAMISGWKAARETGTAKDWLWTGLWMGLGFLSKYTELFQLASWALFFLLWPAARKQLRRPGPYLALAVMLACTTPVLIWNAQHGWSTVEHVGADAALNERWRPTLKYLLQFLGSELGVLNPIYFIGIIWSAIVFWRRNRRNPLLVYFFCMGAPPFVGYLLWSFHSRIQPNWIAPAVLPLLCLMVAYFDTRWRLGDAHLKRWLATGLGLGAILVIGCYQTDLWRNTFPLRRPLAGLVSADSKLKQVLSRPFLPVNLDPLHRVRCWSEVARVADQARQQLAAEGKPTFIIADHYGLVGEISFYLPEARTFVRGEPLVFYKTSDVPLNQFYYWPSYTNRSGANAVFVHELDRDNIQPAAVPRFLQEQFETVTDMGVSNVLYHGQVLRPLQFLACRNLK